MKYYDDPLYIFIYRYIYIYIYTYIYIYIYIYIYTYIGLVTSYGEVYNGMVWVLQNTKKRFPKRKPL